MYLRKKNESTSSKCRGYCNTSLISTLPPPCESQRLTSPLLSCLSLTSPRLAQRSQLPPVQTFSLIMPQKRRSTPIAGGESPRQGRGRESERGGGENKDQVIRPLCSGLGWKHYLIVKNYSKNKNLTLIFLSFPYFHFSIFIHQNEKINRITQFYFIAIYI